MKTKLLILFSLVLAVDARAGSATWNVNPASDDWNRAANWTPHTVPNGPTDTATFPNSNTANLIIHSSVELDALVFGDSTLTAFTIVAGEAGGQGVASLT